MDTLDLAPLVELLDDSIDGLEDALKPLLLNPLTENAGKLPLLDKAQLYVLVTYAIESILFSYLRLNGINAKEHPVFRELTRVKQYFEKVKAAETVGDNKTPNVQLDKAAASRFIKHALGDNDRHDQKSAKELEKRKLALQQRIASHSANNSQNKPSSEQSKERELNAKLKTKAIGEKRKSDAISDNNPETSEDSSSSEHSKLGQITDSSGSNLPAPIEMPEARTLKSPKDPKRTSKKPK